MTFGTMGVDWEERVDYARLRKERLAKAKEQVQNYNLGALLCFDPNNVRYITSTHIGEWARDKMGRYCILPREADPILYDFGSAVVARQMYSPWIAERVRPTTNWMRGAVPPEVGAVDRFVGTLKCVLAEHGVIGQPVGIDIMDVPLMKALQVAGIEVADGQQPMLDARLIKTKEEIELLETAAMMVDSAYDEVVRAIRPGVKENELVAVVNHVLYSLGSDDVECVNVVSGPRTNPHPHVFSDRVIRPGDLVFLDIMHSYNGYRTCYYRTFVCGAASREQEDLYKQAYDWLQDSIRAVRPGATTADIAACWPGPAVWGLETEAEALALAFGHGIGLSIWEKPVISRLFSLEHPFPIKEGMVFALETYAGPKDGRNGARIEEEVVVTADGCRVITGYPCHELIECGV